MATSMQRRTPSTFGLFPLLSRDIDLLQQNMRRIFQGPQAGTDVSAAAMPQALTWVPPVEISETPDELVITAEIPGIAADEVHVMIDGDTLTIRGEKRDERREEDDDTRYYLVERSYGVFQRSFTLPNTVDPDSIQAEYNNGVLNIRLRKMANQRGRGREIPVSSGAEGGSQRSVTSGTAGSAQSRAASGVRETAQSRAASGSSDASQSRAASGANEGSGSRSASGTNEGSASRATSGESRSGGSSGGSSSGSSGGTSGRGSNT